MNLLRVLAILLVGLLLLPNPGLAKQGKLLVFAAASLREALEEAAEIYELECQCEVVFSFAGSSVLARQIDAGAPASVYVSANQEWITWLSRRGRVEPNSTLAVAGNRLVIAVKDDVISSGDPFSILRTGKFAMGDPTGVPAGIYAKSALQSLGLWDDVKSNAVYSENVRVSLGSVARGELPAGIVYQSDLKVEPRVRAHHLIGFETHPAINYVAAKTGGGGSGAVSGFPDIQHWSEHFFKIWVHPAIDGGIAMNLSLSPDAWVVVLLSLKVSLVAMLFTVPIATAVAYLLATRRFLGWHIVNGLCHLPLVMPPVITGYLLLQGFRPDGVFGRLFEQMFAVSFTFQWTGAALAASVMAFPLVMRPIRLAFEAQDREVLEIAKTLGAGKIVSFLTISLPLSLPGILAGAVLGFAKALGEFGATITFVSNIPGETQTLALAVYSLLQSPTGDREALTLIVIGVAISFVAILVSEWISHRVLVRRGGQNA